ALATRRTPARLQAAEPAAHRGHGRGDDTVAEARAQCRAQITDAVGKAELDRLASGPVFTREQGFFWTLEPRAAAAFHEADEVLVDVPLQRLEPLHVVRVFRQERVEHGLVLAGNIEPTIDAELLHQLAKPERGADDPDGADDRGRIAEDLVTGTGDHVAAGGSDVL